MDNKALPSIFSPTALQENVIVPDQRNVIMVDALRDDVSSSLDQIGPRINTLKEMLNRIVAQSESSSKNVGGNINSEISAILPNVPNIHNIAIQSTRRIQSLGLNQQTVTTLSVPRALRPVHDEFFSFKEEFDTALKNVAQLSRNITQKADSLNTTFDTLKNMPADIEKSFGEVEKQKEIARTNTKNIQQLKDMFEQSVVAAHSTVISRFEEKAKKVEELVNELEQKTNEGLNSSALMGEQLQTEKFDMKTSFQDLISEIQKTTNEKLEDVKRKIEKENIDTSAEINEMHDQLSQELNDISQDQSDYGMTSLLDEIEKEQEMTELENLMERFEALSEAVKRTKTNPTGADYEDHEGEWEGKKVIFRCFNNGKFTIQDLE